MSPAPTMQTEPTGGPARGRRFHRWVRTLHIYASLAAFLLLLFFATTGFMMNHGDAFGVADLINEEQTGTIPAAILDGPDRLALVELLRRDYGAGGPLVELDVGDDEIRAVFAKPGQITDATVDRASGELTVSRELGGATAIMAAIHKGDETGLIGTLLIDATALLLAFVSITGLIMWTSLPKRRAIGLLALAAGALAGLVFGLVVLVG